MNGKSAKALYKRLLSGILTACTICVTAACAKEAEDIPTSTSPYVQIEDNKSSNNTEQSGLSHEKSQNSVFEKIPNATEESPEKSAEENSNEEKLLEEVPTENGSYKLMSNNLYEYRLYDDHAEITKYKGNEKNVEIPSEFNGIPVTLIAFAFNSCTALTSITVPSSVKTVGERAFYKCTSLTSVNISNGTEYIGSEAFYGCNRLTSIVIPNGVKNIGRSAFSGCTSLENVSVPDSVISIEESAFSDTAWYNNQPDGLVYLGKVVYAYKGNMPKNTDIILADNTKGIADSAFCDCTNLQNITIPDSLESLGMKAFYNCSSLKSINIPFGITSIKMKTFYGCSALKSINIPDSVKTRIEGWSFCGCTSLVGIDIPDGVVSISYSAFSDCEALKKITIPESVIEIAGDAFNGCRSLTIYGKYPSTAITHAKEHNIPFVAE